MGTTIGSYRTVDSRHLCFLDGKLDAFLEKSSQIINQAVLGNDSSQIINQAVLCNDSSTVINQSFFGDGLAQVPNNESSWDCNVANVSRLNIPSPLVVDNQVKPRN